MFLLIVLHLHGHQVPAGAAGVAPLVVFILSAATLSCFSCRGQRRPAGRKNGKCSLTALKGRHGVKAKKIKRWFKQGHPARWER